MIAKQQSTMRSVKGGKDDDKDRSVTMLVMVGRFVKADAESRLGRKCTFHARQLREALQQRHDEVMTYGKYYLTLMHSSLSVHLLIEHCCLA